MRESPLARAHSSILPHLPGLSANSSALLKQEEEKVEKAPMISYNNNNRKQLSPLAKEKRKKRKKKMATEFPAKSLANFCFLQLQIWYLGRISALRPCTHGHPKQKKNIATVGKSLLQLHRRRLFCPLSFMPLFVSAVPQILSC